MSYPAYETPKAGPSRPSRPTSPMAIAHPDPDFEPGLIVEQERTPTPPLVEIDREHHSGSSSSSVGEDDDKSSVTSSGSDISDSSFLSDGSGDDYAPDPVQVDQTAPKALNVVGGTNDKIQKVKVRIPESTRNNKKVGNGRSTRKPTTTTKETGKGSDSKVQRRRGKGAKTRDEDEREEGGKGVDSVFE